MEVEPHALLPRLFLARIYLTTGKLSDAEMVYRELKRISPDDPQAYQALGGFYASTGQKERAVSEFRSVLASKPNHGLVKASLIETLLDLNRINEAKALNLEILANNPSFPLWRHWHALILVGEHRYQEATASLQKALKADPKSAATYYFLGVAQKALGFSDLAKSSFTQALKLAPQRTESAVALAGLDTASGDFNEALRLAGSALQKNPNSSPAHLASAQASLGKGDAREGEVQLEEALKADPASLPALAMRLKLDVSQGKTQESVQRISTLVQQDPQNAGLHFLLGLGYFNLKEIEKSEASVRRAIALDPRTPDAYTLLANIDFAKGSIEKAKADLHTAIDAYPRTVSNYVALGTQYEKEGNWEEAKQLYEKAHEVDSVSPFIADELAFIYLEHGGDVNVALSLAQIAKQRMPGSAITADTLGWAYYKLGAYGSAVAQLKESVQKVPNNPVFQYHLGMAYAATGNRDFAERALQRALKYDSNFPFATIAKTTLAKISNSSN
jgi:tetratricopeptide (TPR) repeat protein